MGGIVAVYCIQPSYQGGHGFDCLKMEFCLSIFHICVGNKQRAKKDYLKSQGAKLCCVHCAVLFNFAYYTGRFIMFSVIANIYNKKTKGPTLMELFTATGKVKKFVSMY